MNTPQRGRPKKIEESLDGTGIPTEIEKAEQLDDNVENKIVADKNKTIGELRAEIKKLEELRKRDKVSIEEMETRLKEAGTVALGILQTRWHNWQPFEAPVVTGKTGIHLKDEDGKDRYETISVNYDDPEVPVYVVGLQTRTVDGQEEDANGLILIYIDDNDRCVYLNFVDGWTVTNNRIAAHRARKKGSAYSVKPLKE